MEVSSQSYEERVMEGWLYLIRSNKFGFQYSRKRYYVLHHRHLQTFKSIPLSYNKDPIRSAVIDSSIRVMDNGRKSIRGKVFYIFTLCGSSNYGDDVKLGAINPEEAARWIRSFQDASLKVNQNTLDILDHANYEQPSSSSRPNNSGRVHDTKFVDNTIFLSSATDAKTADIYEPSYWTIFSCHNGLRLFKEARAQGGHNKQRDGHPAIAAVSIINGTPEVVFQTLMSLGSSRAEWDFCFQKGSVIENINGHTDIIHKSLNNDWLPRGMKRRDLLLQRFWRREDDGTYIILYHSVLHKKCPPQKGYVRACVKRGGYVISPVSQCKRSAVRHMLAINWKYWRCHLQNSSARSLTICMLGRLAALREFFKTNVASHLPSNCSSLELKRGGSETSMSVGAQSDENGGFKYNEGELVKPPSDHSSLVEIDDESDEFFDFSRRFIDDHSENGWAANFGPDINSQDICHVKAHPPPAAVLVTKLHEYTVQQEGCADLEEIIWEGNVPCNYEITLPEDQTGNLHNSWSVPDPSSFQIRGETYLEDRKKTMAQSTLMQTVAMDWLKSNKREDHIASRPGNIVQKFAEKGRPEFFFVLNFQVPGSTTYNIVSYHMTTTPVKDVPLLERFIEGDDAFRNSRLKIIAHIANGPWFLRQSVGRPSLVGHLLTVNYIRGKNYMEIDIDIGSSRLARGVAGAAFKCFSSLVVDIAFLIQANTRDELPEHLCGAYRINHLNVSKALLANP